MKKRILNYVLILSAVWSLSSCGYNSMVEKEEAIAGQWSQVENVYQRRMDLIPNLVATVQAYADFEKEALTGVIEARKYAADVKIDASNLTPEQIENFERAQQSLSGALGRFLSVAENYPDLKAEKGFSDLRAQLEGTENRITVERKKFNEAVQGYNTYIRKFPNNLTASMFGFEKKGYFQADQGANKAPDVSKMFDKK
jgi:LemA protein